MAADLATVTPNEPVDPPGDDPHSGEGEDPSGSTPLVLDLDGGGFRFTSAKDGVEFDIDADGSLDSIAWTDEDFGDAFLVLDRNWDGLINDGSELFGDHTLQIPSDEPNGFEALSIYDLPGFGGNGDGLISPADHIFVFLQLWIDTSHDGISHYDELYTLDEWQVEEISLDYIESRSKDRHKNELRFRGHFKFDGNKTGQITDVILQQN